MEKLGKREPCLILMNHSSFIDLKIAATILYPRPFNIVCTSDGFVGKDWLMRAIGCIPTKKFVTDTVLIRDMLFALKKLNSSILMFPEASYSFDGTATPLPESLGKCLKILRVPVVMIRTYGAFARDPLYNNLNLRKVDVSADMEYLLSPEDIAKKNAEELTEFGFMKAVDGDTEFAHIPEWYRWERECVHKEILKGSYHLNVPVDIYMMVDTKSIYKVGTGRLGHSLKGFHLTGCNGRLDYSQKPNASYSLYSDYS